MMGFSYTTKLSEAISFLEISVMYYRLNNQQ